MPPTTHDCVGMWGGGHSTPHFSHGEQTYYQAIHAYDKLRPMWPLQQDGHNKKVNTELIQPQTKTKEYNYKGAHVRGHDSAQSLW